MTPIPEPDPDRSIVDYTLDDHRDCMRAVTEVEACLDRRPDAPGEWVARLRESLAALREKLDEHFAAEESGPLFDQLPTRHPRLADDLEALRVEHGQLLADTDAALERVDGLAGTELPDLRRLNARIQLLTARLRRHEAEENELVIRAYWNEVGVGD